MVESLSVEPIDEFNALVLISIVPDWLCAVAIYTRAARIRKHRNTLICPDRGSVSVGASSTVSIGPTYRGIRGHAGVCWPGNV